MRDLYLYLSSYKILYSIIYTMRNQIYTHITRVECLYEITQSNRECSKYHFEIAIHEKLKNQMNTREKIEQCDHDYSHSSQSSSFSSLGVTLSSLDTLLGVDRHFRNIIVISVTNHTKMPRLMLMISIFRFRYCCFLLLMLLNHFY